MSFITLISAIAFPHDDMTLLGTSFLFAVYHHSIQVFSIYEVYEYFFRSILLHK